MTFKKCVLVGYTVPCASPPNAFSNNTDYIREILDMEILYLNHDGHGAGSVKQAW